MRYFYVEGNEKEKIIEEIEKEIKGIERDLEYLSEDDIEFKQYNTFKKDLDILKRENLVTQTMIRKINLNDYKFLKLPKNVEIIKEDILNCDNENREFLRKKLDNGDFEGCISYLYNIDNVFNGMNIKIPKEIIKALAMIEDHVGIKVDFEKETITKNDIDKIASRYDIKSEKLWEDTNLKEVLFEQYSFGAISVDELCEKMSTEILPYAVNKYFNTKYQPQMEESLKNQIGEILKDQKKLKGIVPKETEDKLANILGPITEKNIQEADIDLLEKIADKYKEFSNEEWKKYLQRKDRCLVHCAKGYIHGKFYDPVISTSLVFDTSMENGKFYGGQGKPKYIIKPKHIMCGGSKDLYILNSAKDQYRSHCDKILKLPQILEEECKSPECEYSEIACDDFEIEAIMSYYFKEPQNVSISELIENNRRVREEEYHSLLPIQYMTKDGLKTIDELIEAQVEFYKGNINDSYNNYVKIAENRKQILNKSSKLGLDNNQGWLDEQQLQANIKLISELDLNNMENLDVEKISQTLSSCNENIWGKIEDADSKKFVENLNNKVQKMIVNAKTQKINKRIQEVSNEKINILERIFGKGKLNDEIVQNLNLQKHLIEPDNSEVTNQEEIMQKLYDYVLENGSTKEINNFLSEYSQIYNIDEQILAEIGEKQDSNSLIPKVKIMDINNSTKRIQMENARLKEEFRKKSVKMPKLDGIKMSETEIEFNNYLQKCKTCLEQFTNSDQQKQNIQNKEKSQLGRGE